MSAELRSFPAIKPSGVDAVTLLEKALEQARNGELGAVAIAVVFRSGDTAHAYSRSDALATLSGSVARLQNALLNA